MLRYDVDDNRSKPPTKLDITSVVSLSFLFLLFEVIGYSKVVISVFAPPGRLYERLTMVEGRAKTEMRRYRWPYARYRS